MKPDSDLSKPVQYLKGVGPKRAEALARLDLRTVGDLLYHLPRSYEDRSRIVKIADVKPGERATIRAQVRAVSSHMMRRHKRMLTVQVEDDSGRMTLVWFHARHVKEEDFPLGDEMLFSGRADFYRAKRRMQMVSPHFEGSDTSPEEALYTTRILPEYPLCAGVPQTIMRRMVRQALDLYVDRPEDLIPERLSKGRKLPDLQRALLDVHFPESLERAARARRRMVYEDFFLLELGMALRRQNVKHEAGIAFEVSPRIDERFFRLFPFEPTGAQRRVIGEIAADMQRPAPMNRLLQGDVGSGKTMVAMYPLLVAIANGCQAAIMAPTEILAEQHCRRFRHYLRHGRVRMELMSGGSTPAERRRLLGKVAAGEVDLVVGTQALIQKDVDFKQLGVVVVDEQHKFGVLQRHTLRQKGRQPDVLVMTATPIPRTMSLTVFGDLDVSTLDEMPPGRQPVTTRFVEPKNLRKAYQFIAGRIAKGEQAYLVYPLVETSDRLAVKAAVDMADELAGGPFRGARVGLLHGRMSSDEKERTMRAFHSREIDLLVATQVVEVGVDVPNATVMMVEHAERFGLAQLHQLRGRIGRGTGRSWFLVAGEPNTEEAKRRIAVLVQTTDGFRIAEEDLRIRGPGEFFGTKQHGLPELKIADIMGDFRVLRMARKDAFEIVERDPRLDAPEHAALREAVLSRYRGRLELIHVG